MVRRLLSQPPPQAQVPAEDQAPLHEQVPGFPDLVADPPVRDEGAPPPAPVQPEHPMDALDLIADDDQHIADDDELHADAPVPGIRFKIILTFYLLNNIPNSIII